MEMKFNFKNIHHCEAVVLTCIDFRFWRETAEFIEKKLGIKNFDFPSLPGAAKALNESADQNDLVWQCLRVPVELHEAKKIVIVNHADCGAYGGIKKFNGNQEMERRFHQEELKKAKIRIAANFPNQEVILVFAGLSDDGEKVVFSLI